jgi:hypothetical protein
MPCQNLDRPAPAPRRLEWGQIIFRTPKIKGGVLFRHIIP